MATFSDFLKNFREAASVAKSFDESVPKGTYTNAHLERENGGGYSINYTPIDSSNTRKHSSLSDVDGYKAVTDASLNSLKDRQSRDFRGNRLDSKYYNYIPFTYDGEGGVQYGLIQTPSFAEDEIVNVYLDNGVNMGAKDAMEFLSSVKTSNALHLPEKQYSYKEFSGLSPTDWLNNMRKKYLQEYPDTYYSRGTNEAVRRYNLTGEL